MPSRSFATALAIITLMTGTAHAVDASLQLELGRDGGNFEQRSVLYDCTEGEPFSVVYINAAPNFLALVPIAEEPERLVFASVVAASGVRYTAGHWAWWTQGVDASLYDVTLGEDADPVLTCSEFIQTP